MKLRDYQQECSDAVMKEFETHASTAVIMPTGTGKTVLFSDVIRRFQPKRSMVLAHRSQLIYQANDKIELSTALRCEIEMANQVAEMNSFESAPVILSTVQTQSSGAAGKERMRRFDPMDFGLLVIDEFHHSTSKSYRKIIDYYRTNPLLKVLGLTATPDRTDEEALSQIVETVAYDYEIIDAIHDGYLVPIDQQFVQVHDLDFSAVRTTAGDLNGADLAALMEEEKNMQEVASASIQIIGEKRTLIFTASVKQAETLCNIFNRHRSDMAAFVCGKTPLESRKDLLHNFSNGNTQVIINCALLTEGYDNPGVEVVIMARPTKSRSLYAQTIGRGTRPLTGVIDNLDTKEERKLAIASSSKAALLVVDFVGNSGRHKLMTSADILGGKVSERAIEIAKEEARKSGTSKRMSDLLDAAEAKIKEDEERLKQEGIKIRISEAEARKARLVANAKFSTRKVSPFELYDVAQQGPSEWERRNNIYLSEKQKNVLRTMGVEPGSVSVSCGRKLIGKYFDQPTPAQAKVLVRFGYSTSCTKNEASNIISTLSSNGWKRPEEQKSLESAQSTHDDEMAPF